MSGRNNPELRAQDLLTLHAKFLLMNADGTNIVQLKHFNTPGFTESTQKHNAATYSTWSPDVSQLIAQQLVQQSYTTAKKARFWLITFAAHAVSSNTTRRAFTRSQQLRLGGRHVLDPVAACATRGAGLRKHGRRDDGSSRKGN